MGRIGYHCWLVNPEWARYITTALVSTGTYVGGIFTGLFIKSLEEWLKTRVERRRLRKALYQELGQNLEQLIYIVWNHEAPPMDAWARFPGIEEFERREVYDLALKSQPVLFRGIKEANLIGEFYLAMDALKTAPPEQQVKGIRHLKEYLFENARKGQLSRRMLHKAFTLTGVSSRLSHPLRRHAGMLYNTLSTRNIPKDGKTRAWEASPTLFKKVKALWRGIPGDEKPLPPGPSPVGKRIL
jgi:hypothetical protein